MADELQDERNRLINRIRQQLWRYYPQMLDPREYPGADWFLDIWALAPTPAIAAKLTEKKAARASEAIASAGLMAQMSWRSCANLR